MITKLFLSAFVLLASMPALAKDVYVRGYTTKSGTYVAPYVRSSPDNSKANNYGPSTNSWERTAAPRSRDWNRDGAPNYLSRDDDSDRLDDQRDPTQYGGSRSSYSPWDSSRSTKSKSDGNSGWGY